MKMGGDIMRTRNKYMLLKGTTIFFGALSIPWSTFTGFCFGDGRYFTGLVSLAAQTAVALVDGYIWFWVLENMKNKIQGEAKPMGISLSSRRESCPLLFQERALYGGLKAEYPSSMHLTTQPDDLKKDFVTGSLNLERSVEHSQ